MIFLETMRYRNLYIINCVLLGLLISSYELLSEDETEKQIEKINQVIKAASGSHVDNVESKKLVDAAIRGLLKELDPYSYYFTADEVEEISNRRTGSYYGVGFHSLWMNDTLQIVGVTHNSPAEISGIKIGDKVIRINGTKIVGMDKEKVESMFRADKSIPMTFDILKPNQKELRNIKLRKVKLPLNSVDAAYIVDGTDVGYIAVNRFMNSTYYEVLDSLTALNEQGMKSLIIDLRNNPGGLIDQTYMIADEFITDGDDIIITKGKDPQYNIRYKSSPSGKYEELPIVVLIDSTTISAPEIFAGAIQDLDRGIIVGQTSYGKGVVQNPIKLTDGSELWLTVAKYFTPSGRSIHKDTLESKKNQNVIEDRFILKDGMIFSQNVEVETGYSYNDSVPVYTSKYGRHIYGGGGITPDYYVEEGVFNELSVKLIEKNVPIKAAIDFMVAHGDSIANLYFENYKDFYDNFQINDSILENLKVLAAKNYIDWDEQKFKEDEDLLKISIKSMIAGMIWTNNEKYRVFNSFSNQIKKALDIMPVAEKILDVRKN